MGKGRCRAYKAHRRRRPSEADKKPANRIAFPGRFWNSGVPSVLTRTWSAPPPVVFWQALAGSGDAPRGAVTTALIATRDFIRRSGGVRAINKFPPDGRLRPSVPDFEATFFPTGARGLLGRQVTAVFPPDRSNIPVAFGCLIVYNVKHV